MDTENTAVAEAPETDVNDEADSILARYEAHQNAAPVIEKPADKPVEVEKPAATEKQGEVEKPAKEEPDDMPPGPKTEAAKKTWATMKAELAELRGTKLPATEKLAAEREIALQEAQKRIAEFEGKDITQYEKKIADLESKVSEAEKFRAIHDVQNSQTYRDEILKPAAEIGEAMDVFAKMYTEDGEDPAKLKADLKNALQIEDVAEQRKRINAITEGWNQLDAADFLQAARTTRQLLSRSQELLDNAETTKKELQFISEREGKKKADADIAAMKAATAAVEKQLFEKFSILGEDVTTAEEVRKAQFEDTPTNRALAAKLWPLVRALNDKFLAGQAKIKEFEADIAKRSAAKPKPNTNTSVAAKTEDGGLDQSSEGLMARWNASQAGA